MAFSLKDTFGTVKPVIAMVHFPGLPGRPQHDRAAGRAHLVDVVARDLAALQDAGADGLLLVRPMMTDEGPVLMQYWRSYEELDRWARQQPHSRWWRWPWQLLCIVRSVF